VGVAPEDVDIVVNTHLHSDHCGGNTTLRDGEVVPTFPNAEYWVQRLEYADAAFPNERTRATYLAENFASLYESGQMRLVDGETEIMPGVRCVVTPGHTRGHQSVVIERGGQTALYTGDMATFAVHFERLAWLTAYDVEPLVNLETKRAWQRWALAHDALVLFPHDTGTPMGRLVEGEGGKLHIAAF
jgi:glyoxylase-like metal-dependent hydrolase (beta-lactamase superfamily II)